MRSRLSNREHAEESSRRRHRPVLPILIAAVVAVGGCGKSDTLASDVHDLADEFAVELETQSEVSADVVCSEPRSDEFDCRAYEMGRPDAAAKATFLVHRCQAGGWRARRVAGSSAFPDRVELDTGDDPSVDCAQ